MSGTRVVVETTCEHGRLDFHWLHMPSPPAFPELSDGCPGGSRRTLTPGEYVLIERNADRTWPEWKQIEDDLYQAWSSRVLNEVLDALAGTDHGEGT